MSRPDSTRPRIWLSRQTLKLISSAIATCAAAACLAFLCSGCAQNRVHASAPVTVPPNPPAPVPVADKGKSSPDSIPAPTTPAPKNPVPTTPPADLNPKPENPKRPETSSPQPAEPERPAAPQISPQISPSDQSQLQQQANQLISSTQQNLHRSDGRQLNSTQKDMVDKIRGFLAQAQNALTTSDWERAKKLSDKAYLLSLELLKTL